MKQIIIIIFLLTASVSNSSENHDFQILELEERLDGYQRDAVIAAIPDKIISLFEMYFTESHFPSFPIDSHIRKNLGFFIDFKGLSVDLNDDGILEVLVRLDHTLACGSGGCYTYILVKENGTWKNRGSLFGAGNIHLRNIYKNGFQVIYFQTRCMSSGSGDTKKIWGCYDGKSVADEQGNYLERVRVSRTPIN